MQQPIPGTEHWNTDPTDIVITPEGVASEIVQHFKPTGRILDPCKGEGAFTEHLNGAEWCEIMEGRDFFEWHEPVDWIVSNPPYSIFSAFLRHSMEIAENVVYLIPVNKAFNSTTMMKEIWTWGGVPEIHVIGSGGELGFPIGFCIGAVHFQREYQGGTFVTFSQRCLPDRSK